MKPRNDAISSYCFYAYCVFINDSYTLRSTCYGTISSHFVSPNFLLVFYFSLYISLPSVLPFQIFSFCDNLVLNPYEDIQVRYLYFVSEIKTSHFFLFLFKIYSLVKILILIWWKSCAEQEYLGIMRKFTEVLSSLKGDLTAGEQWLLRFIYVGGKEMIIGSTECCENTKLFVLKNDVLDF